MEQDKQIAVGKLKMNKDAHEGNLSEMEYTHALNMSTEDTMGNGLLNPQRDPSNLLCTRFKDGFNVIGFKVDIVRDRVWFFLTNPTTSTSEIGYISAIQNIEGVEDLEVKCGCDYKKILSEPLELQEQIESCEYTTFLNDSCNKCFNFSIHRPIHFIELNDDILYFTDGLNTRTINTLTPEVYRLAKKASCGDEEVSQCDEDPLCSDCNDCDECLNCDRMKFFRDFKIPCLKATSTPNGGNLRQGTYMYAVSYCNVQGVEVSEYYSTTPLIPINDVINNNYEQPDVNKITNKSIRLSLTDLDTSYEFFKILCIHQTGRQGEYTVSEIGVFPTSTNEVVHATNENLTGRNLTDWNLTQTKWITSRGLMSSGGYLFPFGLKAEETLNLQPAVMLMSPFLRWQMGVARESIYEQGAGDANFTGYYRNETYPFSIQFEFEDGDISHPFVFTSRPPTSEGTFSLNEVYQLVDDEGEVITEFPGEDEVPEGVSKDVASIVQFSPPCDGLRKFKWQFYNTARTVVSTCDLFDDEDTETFEQISEVTCESEVEDLSADSVVLDEIPIEFDGSLVAFINQNRNEFGGDGKYPIPLFHNILNNSYTPCEPENDCNLVSGASNRVIASEATGEEIDVILQPLSNYPQLDIPIGCTQHQIDPSTGDFIDDTDANTLFSTSPASIYKRVSNLSLQSCTGALNIDTAPGAPLYLDYFYDSGTPTNKTLLKQNVAIEGGCVDHTLWSDALHKGAVWFRGTFGPEGKAVVEISRLSLCQTPAPFILNRDIRITTYNGCINVGNNIRRFIDFQGTSGSVEVEITLGGTTETYALTFDTDLNTTLSNFIIAHLSQIQTDFPTILDVIVQGDSLRFEYDVTSEIRLDLINSSGITGTLRGNNITCDVFDGDNGFIMELDRADFTSDSFFIALDAPIITHTVGGIDNFLIEGPCGCFLPAKRDLLIERIELKWESLKFSQVSSFLQRCELQIPKVDDCRVVPFIEGEFGYYESLITYPDNKELFDASEWIIPQSILSNFTSQHSDLSDVQTNFEDMFTSGVDGQGNYVLKGEGHTNLTCQPIRHYKFPDQDIAPFTTSVAADFQESIIFPLGVKIDNRIVNLFLDLAVENNLISQHQRNRIVGYRILRGDRTIDKSILSKGVMYDMYEYEEDLDPFSNTIIKEKVLYSNYPFNSLGNDQLRFTDRTRTQLVPHKFNSLSNNRWTYHSPDIHLKFPAEPMSNEMIVEGYLYGRSRGRFNEVEEHPRHVILGRQARALATTLAIAEVAFETAVLISTTMLEIAKTQWSVVGVSSGGGFVGTGTGLIQKGIIILQLAATATQNVGRKRYEWLEIFRNNGRPRNLAYKYAADGYYNFFKSHSGRWGHKLRGLTTAKFLKNAGRYSTVDGDERIIINHLDRESSGFISTGRTNSNEFNLEYPSEYRNYDNTNVNITRASRRKASDAGAQGEGQEFLSNVASPYVAIKQYLPAQYGAINNIRWVHTGYCGRLNKDNKCDIIFGGDIRITRMSLKRKLPFFTSTAFGQASLTPFAYSLYHNIGNTRFYADLDINLQRAFSLPNLLFPDVGSYIGTSSDRTLDQYEDNFYIQPPSKYYLQYYGVAQFICESEINSNFRYGGLTPERWFYPNGGTSDYNWWTQERNVSIRKDNYYAFNQAYFRNPVFEKRPLLPVTFNKEEYARRLDERVQGVICSQPRTSQFESPSLDFVDPWTIFYPSDYFEFPEKAGKLYELKDLESGKVLGRFKNQMMLLNALDTLRDRVTPDVVRVGMGIFKERPMEFKRTDLGILGTQHSLCLTTPYGYFWADPKRGAVIWVDNSGTSPVDCAEVDRNGQPSLMRSWFRKHLPFKVLNGGVTNLTEEDLDNAYNGLGITLGWDDRFKRVFLTKRDVKVKQDYVGALSFEGGKFFYAETEVSLDNPTYFEDASFTISYSPRTQSWMSFYSFTPNYYISLQNFFQTGKNTTDNRRGLWSHLLSDQSFNVYYGEKFPFSIEIPIKSKLTNTNLNGIEYWNEVRRYRDNTYTIRTNIGFDRVFVYNNRTNSGLINLITEEPNNRRQKAIYPRFNLNSTDILQTPDQGKWTFNHIFNRLKDNNNNVSVWRYDVNQINKSINPNSLKQTQRGMWDRVQGDWFLARFEYDSDSRLQFLCRWWTGKRNFVI